MAGRWRRSAGRVAAIAVVVALGVGGVGAVLAAPTTANASGASRVVAALSLPTPTGIAYDTALSELFVTEYGSESVAVVSDPTHVLVTTVAVGRDPYGIAYDPAKGEMFVTNSDSNTVSVIDDTNRTVVATIHVGEDPSGIAYDPAEGELFVANQGTNNLSVVNDTNDSVVATIATGAGPISLEYVAPLGALYVAELTSNFVAKVNPATDEVVGSVEVGGADGLTYDAGTGQLFATEYDAGRVAVLNASSLALVSQVPVHPGPVAAAYVPATHDVYVADQVPWYLDVVRDTNDFVGATIALGGEPFALLLDPGTGELAVTEENVDELLFLAPASVTVGSGIPTGAPSAESTAVVVAAGLAVALVGAGVATGVVGYRSHRDEWVETTEPLGRRRADGRTYALLAGGAAVGAATMVYVWLGASGLAGGAGSTSANLSAGGVTIGVGSGTLTALLGVGGIAAVQLALFLVGFARFRSSDPRFALPSLLVWVGLAGIPLVAGGLVVLLDAFGAAGRCAGTLEPIPSVCLPNGEVDLAARLILAGAVLGLVGFVGMVVGLLRSAETVRARPMTSGALLLVTALVLTGVLLAIGAYALPSLVGLTFVATPLLALLGYLAIGAGAALASRNLRRQSRLVDVA